MVVKLKLIRITRAEGPTYYAGRTKEFTSFRAASSWLMHESPSFPKTGGYDKHDLFIEWEDGRTYKGRLDCKASTCKDNDLDVYQHVLDFATFMSGRVKGPWCDDVAYEQILAENDRLHPGSAKRWGELIDTHLKGVEV